MEIIGTNGRPTSGKPWRSPNGHQEETLAGSSKRRGLVGVVDSQKIYDLHGSCNRFKTPRYDSTSSVFSLTAANSPDEELSGTGAEQPASSILDTSQKEDSTFCQYTDLKLTKKELRLEKNREAARQCRRKKKAYIRGLEERVATLEKENKELLIELHYVKSHLGIS